MAADSTFFEVLETDLRQLSAEARKNDSIATQISGWLSHTDFPQIKESAERAVLKLRAISQERKGIEAVRTSKDILRPFLLVCESKNPRLVSLALGSIQKVLANDAVSAEGRSQIIGALHQVEKSHDDTVKLKILQTLLTLLQNAGYADDEAGAAQILSLCFRTYSHNKSSPTVISTAAATIRQAVAILFDHAVLPGGSGRRPSSSSGSAGSNGREAAALSLLGDLCSMSEGSTPVWLKCPLIPRPFVLDLLEFVLLHRPQAFHTLAMFTAMLQEKVCPMLESLTRSALDPDLDAPGLAECRQVLKCLGALLRKHATLLPDMAPALLELLLLGCSASRTPWQRIFSLQIVRSVVADPSLLYALFVAYDCSIHHDANAVHDIVKVAIDLVKAFVKQASEHPDEDAFGALNSLYMAKAAGKETVPDGDSLGPLLAGSDVWVGYLALEVLLAVVADVEALTDAALAAESSVGAAPVPVQQPGSARSASHSRSASTSSQQPSSPVQAVSTALCSTLVDVLWRMVLQGLSCMLARATQEALVLALLKGYQCYTYSAGALNEKTARDGFLASLCEFTLAASQDEGSAADRVDRATSSTGEGQASESGGASAPRSSTAVPVPAGQAASAALEARGDGNLVLTTKNLHALRTLFNCAHRLADGLGPSWVHVVDVLNSLDRLLSSQSAATKDALAFEGGDGALPSELYILATAANQLFETTSHMSTDAVVSLLSALAEVSARSLPSSSTVDKPRLAALNRMVETLLYNLYRIQDLWGIFLAHVMEVLRSSNPHVRATAIDALDRCISGALGPTSKVPRGTSPTGSKSSSKQPATSKPPQQPSTQANAAQPGTPQAASTSYGDAVEHMLLVALESLYREEREPDVRQGLLRVTLHVLQRHGDGLSRGWVPLLRLLEAVPSWEDNATISLAFQSAEAICSDFLSTIPKEHITRALEVLHLFAAQKAVINISLTAIGVLWNVTDFFGRCRAAAALERTASSTSSTMGDKDATGSAGSSAGSSRRATGDGSPAPSAAPSGAAAAAVAVPGQGLGLGVGGMGMGGLELLGGGDGSHGTGRRDLNEAELTELLLVVYRLLRNLAMDRRPEVRNSGVRTLFLAVGGQAPRFDPPTWRYCLWEVMFPLIKYVHYMGDTSSSEEAAAVELGKERGKTVHMLMHHSRNTEQKQWDETTVLALNGLAKLLRAHLGGMMAMEGFDTKWDDLMGIVAAVLCAGRRSTGVAAAQLLTGALQAYKPQSTSQPAPFMWKRAIEAIDAGVKVMAVPQSHVPLQVRTELLNGVASIYAAQKEAFDLQDTQRYLAWCDAFARHPVGTDDQAPVHGVLPPVQKAALLALSHLCPVVLPGIWPELLVTLSGLLCPQRAEAQRAAEAAAKAAAAAATAAMPSTPSPASSPIVAGTSSPAAHGGTLVLPVRSPRASTSAAEEPHTPTTASQRSRITASPPSFRSGRSGGVRSPRPDAASAVDAKFLSPLLMTRLIGQLLVLYRDHAPWQVRASHFGVVTSALAECMASRATLGPTEDLWRHAALAFNAVVNAGLPAVNIAYVNHQSPPDNTWQALTGAFEGFFAADDASTSGTGQQSVATAANGSSNGVVAVSEPSGHRRRSSTSGPAILSDAEIQASVLDTLTDAVLTACASAPLEVRLRLLGVVDRGAAAGAAAAHKQWQAMLSQRQQEQQEQQRGASTAGDSTSAPTQEPQQQQSQDGQQAQHRQQSQQASSSAGRFSQLCIRKLFVLCSRGTDATGANRCLLEVAQLTLPLLLDRCEALLEAFRLSEDAAADAGLQPPPLLVEDALCALEAVSMMRLDPAVMDAAVLRRPGLRSWLEAARLRRGFDDVDRKEQLHLLALYGACARCCGCREPRMRAMLRRVLVAVGHELGLDDGGGRNGGAPDSGGGR